MGSGGHEVWRMEVPSGVLEQSAGTESGGRSSAEAADYTTVMWTDRKQKQYFVDLALTTDN